LSSKEARGIDDRPDNVTVRFIREGDEEGIARLLLETFPRWPFAEIEVPAVEHLRWKLRSHPLAYSHHVVAETAGRIIGLRVFFVQTVRVQGEDMLTFHGLDNAVHPDMQGRGVMAKMRFFRLEELSGSFDIKVGGQSGHPAMTKLRERAGETFFGNPVRQFVRASGTPIAPARGRACDIRHVRRFDERVDGFFDDASTQFEFILVRSKEYLDWRYGDPRAGTFDILCAEEGSRLLGYAVLRISYGRGYIADLLALPGRDDVVDSLLASALATLERSEVTDMECRLPGVHPYRAALERQSFREGRRIMPMTFLPCRATAERLEFLSHSDAAMHQVLADVDLV
jgi:hypothetical protein